MIRLDTLYHNLEQKVFIAGGIPTWFYENRKIQNMDVLQLEELTILNAIPTVEGTISRKQCFNLRIWQNWKNTM